jgi:hypothetical protein
MSDERSHIDRLFTAELQFRLASAVRLAVTEKGQPLDLPKEWIHGKHRVYYDEVALRQDQADYAARNLQRSATYLMAVAIKDAIRATFPDPKAHANTDVAAAYQISRLIRNAFAHSPFDPTWSIDQDCRNRAFSVRNIVTLDTSDLNATKFDWRHYGGPLALFRLSQFTRFEILNDPRPRDRVVVPIPKNIYIQQGDLILKKVSGPEPEN